MATFGKTSVGASTNDQGSERIRACRFQLTEAGTVTKITAYLNKTGNVYAAIYDDNAGVPNNLKASSGAVSVSGWAWYDFTVNVALSAGYYWLCFRAPSLYWKYDAGVTNQEAYKLSGTFPDPFGTPDGYGNYANSIYATYTTGGTLQTVTDSLSLSDSVLRHKTLLPITDVLGLADAVLRNKTLTIADSVGAADSVKGDKSPLIVSDVLSLADLVNVITGAIIKTVLDTIGLADLALVNKPVAIADTVSVLDAIFRHKPSVTVSDAIGAAEVVLVAKLLAVADSVNLADVARVLKTLNVSDSLTFG